MYNRLPVFGAALLLATQATAAIQVNIEPTTLLTNEDGSAVTYFVVLDQAPSAGETVTVTPSSGDVTEGTVSGAVLFTDANWDVPQTITVTPGASGDGNDGDVMYTIGHTTTAAGGTASFNGAPSSSVVSATNRNIEGINTIVMDPASGGAFYLTEGTSQTVTVSVTGAPTNNISIDVSIAGAEATVTPATVILAAGNGFEATFNVTAVDDTNIDGDQPFTVVVDPAVSLDINYSGQNLSDINGVALDNDVAAPPPAPAQVTPVPTLPLFGILALSGLLGLFGMFGMRKTKA
ncbi:P pilus assembly chaperone PapD [Marinobacterium sp. MBR-111]|jgi:P pilus assembly chaperone PapD|uniref:IPTL-CTERM sorting domain-containing protein n=1 Tax=Marinobacterium sp. MBR-111 TaxID=3156463 RepID=UPI003393857C